MENKKSVFQFKPDTIRISYFSGIQKIHFEFKSEDKIFKFNLNESGFDSLRKSLNLIDLDTDTSVTQELYFPIDIFGIESNQIESNKKKPSEGEKSGF
jgi:hypothetical protein